jgi:protein TonB
MDSVPVLTNRGMKKSLLLGRGDTSFAISLALHLAFIGFFWVSRSLTPSFEDAPEGVFRKGNPTWIEVGSFQEQAFEKAKKPKVVPVKTLDPDAITLPAEKRAEKEERIERKTDVPAETTFGHAEGTATEGELGVEGGRKASLRERYIYELRLLLEGRKVYPNLSRSMRETGR